MWNSTRNKLNTKIQIQHNVQKANIYLREQVLHRQHNPESHPDICCSQWAKSMKALGSICPKNLTVFWLSLNADGLAEDPSDLKAVCFDEELLQMLQLKEEMYILYHIFRNPFFFTLSTNTCLVWHSKCLLSCLVLYPLNHLCKYTLFHCSFYHYV